MDKTKLYLGNLRRLDKNDITEAFEKFGKITDLWLATPPSGFGFLSFETPEEAEEAVRTMDGKDLHGTVIRVEFAKAPKGEIHRDSYRPRRRSYRSRSRSHSRRHHHHHRSYSPSYSRSRSRSHHHHSSRHVRERSSSRHHHSRRHHARHHSSSYDRSSSRH